MKVIILTIQERDIGQIFLNIILLYIYIYRLRVNLRERCKEYFEKAIISLK